MMHKSAGSNAGYYPGRNLTLISLCAAYVFQYVPLERTYTHEGVLVFKSDF